MILIYQMMENLDSLDTANKIAFTMAKISQITLKIAFVGFKTPHILLPVAGQVRLGEKLSEQHAVCHVLEHCPL